MINVKLCSAWRHSGRASLLILGFLKAVKEQTGGGPGRSENPEEPDGNGAAVRNWGESLNGCAR